MSVRTPVPRVHQLVRLGLFSCYLVETDDGLTLIDTNFFGSTPGIRAEVERLGKPLRRILITHAHADHVGSLDALAEAFPGIDIAASRRTARLLAGDRSLDADEAGLSLKGGYLTTRTRPNLLVDDGQIVAGFRAIDTPGHAIGHMSWMEITSGYLFAGDALASAGGGLHVTGVFRLGFPFPYFVTASRAQALASARKLAAARPTAIFPVHGRAVLDPAEDLARAIAEAERAFA